MLRHIIYKCILNVYSVTASKPKNEEKSLYSA